MRRRRLVVVATLLVLPLPAAAKFGIVKTKVTLPRYVKVGLRPRPTRIDGVRLTVDGGQVRLSGLALAPE